jgi:peptidoglycan biosynthesis protein MviN/MurJ (putative lipid II flippase)
MLAAHTFSPSGVLKGMGQTPVVFVGQSVAFVSGVGLVVLGIRVAGLPGAALGKVVAECLRKGIYAVVLRRRLGPDASSLLPWPSWLRIAAASAAAAAPAAAVTLLLAPGLLRMILCTAVFAPACLGVLLVTRSLTRADRELLLRWISLRALLGRDSG